MYQFIFICPQILNQKTSQLRPECYVYININAKNIKGQQKSLWNHLSTDISKVSCHMSQSYWLVVIFLCREHKSGFHWVSCVFCQPIHKSDKDIKPDQPISGSGCSWDTICLLIDTRWCLFIDMIPLCQHVLYVLMSLQLSIQYTSNAT